MENDSIRASGTDTLVDIWIDGKMRSICITQEAFGAYLDFEQVARMSEDERCGFVKNNLALVVSGAKSRLREGDPTASTVLIDAGHLARPDGKATDRRKTVAGWTVGAEKGGLARPRKRAERAGGAQAAAPFLRSSALRSTS